ncbi:MAG TPA: nucleoside hydrolase [Marmoricola sp.]|nr:nucleoside hydrolase [Marmoricola sp.]
MARPVVLDCDTGTDDAVAIMLAARHPALSLLGVCSVFGNAGVEETTANAERVLTALGRADVPVERGSPVAGSASSAAVEWLVALLRRTTEPVTLVATGPLTNLAAALAAEPGLVEAVDELVVMGGTFGVVAAGPVERNLGNDPAAAAAVLSAGFARVVLVPLDATYQALMGPREVAALRALGPIGELAAGFVAERIEQYASMPLDGRAPVHDPLTVAYLVDPAVVSLTAARVEVAVDGRTTLGTGPVNALVATSCDAARFRAFLLTTLG